MAEKKFGFIAMGIALIVLISGCTQIAGTEELNSQFQLKINQTAFIQSENLKIKFLDVTEDSRCPSGVVCIWEGQVTILVNVSKNNENLGDFSLTSRAGSGYEGLAVESFDSYTVRLVKVEAYPISTQSRKASDYIATLIVSKADTGFLEGKISIGPLCPVETIPPQPECQPTQETYNAYPISLYEKNSGKLVATITGQMPDGKYSVVLPAGTYEIRHTSGVIDYTEIVIIESGKTTTLDISIDTGIR